MSDIISRALAVINGQLDALQAVMTDEPIDVVTERYRTWKRAARPVLAEIVVESLIGRFDLVRGQGARREGRRPIPQVFLDGAASRAFLAAMKTDLLKDPAAVLRLGPLDSLPSHPSGGIRTLLDLLEHGLAKAFRGEPETERDVGNGFEGLLVGTGLAYERESDPMVHSSGKYAPDFTFPVLQTALKLKLCRRPGREHEIITEINDEIPAYRTKYPRILFGVYDLGFIQDPNQFSATFKARDECWVRVTQPYRS